MEKKYYTLRTNIDGSYTVRIDKNINLNELGLLFRVQGLNQLYTLKTKKNELKEKINLIQDVTDSKLDKYFKLRKYDKQAEFEMLNIKDFNVYTEDNYFTYCEFNGDIKSFLKAKYNFEFNGIPLAIPKVDKGQLFFFEENFYKVTDIIKSEIKGGKKKIIAELITPILLTSITRLYKGMNDDIEIVGEFEDYLDALLAMNKFYRNNERVHL